MTDSGLAVERTMASALKKGETLGAVAFERMRADILRGTLKPDEPLRFQHLRALYGLNVGTLREGLSRLAAEGLVIGQGQRGFRVSPMSETDLIDVTDMRTALDSMALLKAIERGDLEWETNIVAAYHQLSKTPRTAPRNSGELSEEWETKHRAFHLALIAACKSPLMMQMHAILFDRSDRYRRISFKTHPVGYDAMSNHRAIMEAAVSRDSVRACELLAEHIRRTTENVLRASRQSEVDDSVH